MRPRKIELHDRVLTLKLTETELRSVKAAARERNERLGTWARAALVERARRETAARTRSSNGHVNGTTLATPVLPR